MKIGLITGEFPPMEGGIGDFTANLAQAMAEQGHEVHILTNRKAKLKIKRQPSKSVSEAVQKLGNNWEPQDLEYASLHPRFRRWNWSEMSTIADIAIRHELDILNVQYQPAAFNMRNPAINYLPFRVNSITKTIATFHDLRPPYLFPKAGRLRKRVVYKLAQRAHGTILTNPANGAELQDHGFGTQHQTMIPIGNNVPTNHVNHLEIIENRNKLNIPEDAIILGYFGFLNDSKGADDLVSLLEKLGDRYHLLIMGGGTGDSDSINNQSYTDTIKGDIEMKGLASRVHWTDYLPSNRVSSWLKTADVMVLPYKDGVSTRRGSLMSALANGVPIVSTQAELINPLLKDGENMLLAPTGDVEAMATKVRLIADDQELAERLRKSAKETAAAFTWPEIARETLEFYRSVLDSKDE